MQSHPLPFCLKNLVMIPALFTFALSAQAEGTGLTLVQALSLTEKHHPSLWRSGLEVAARQRQDANSFVPLLPTVAVSSGLSRANSALDSSGSPVSPPLSANISVGVSVSLALSNVSEIETTRSNLKISLAAHEVARRSLEKTVKTGFYGLLLQQEGLQVERQSLDRIRLQYEQTQLSHKAGLVSDLDLMTAQANLATARNTVEALRQNFIRQKEQFFVLLSSDLTPDSDLIGTLPGPEMVQNPHPEGPGTAPEINLTRTNLEAAQKAQEIQKWAPWLPTLAGGWTTAPTRADVTSGDPRWADTSGGLNLTVSWNLNNLLPWSPTTETAAQLGDQIRRLESQLAEESRLHALQKHQLEGQVLQSLASLELLKENLVLTQRAYDLTAEAYRKGAKDGLSLRTAEGELQKAHCSVLNERYNLAVALVNLEYETSLSTPLPTGAP